MSEAVEPKEECSAIEPPPTKKKRRVKRVIEKDPEPAIVRLYRFLYTGNEDGLYVAGTWNPEKYYDSEKVPCIANMTSDADQAKQLIEAIKFVKGKCFRIEPCLFGLALAVKTAQSDAIRTLLYTEASGLLANSDEFLHFIHHLSALKTGTGAGWRRLVSSWYKSVPPPQLAAMLGQATGAHGWTHRDVLRLAHGIKLPDSFIPLKTVLSYASVGLPATEEKFGKEDMATEVLTTLRMFRDMKTCSSVSGLLSIVEANSFITPKTLAACVLAGKLDASIWNVLLERLPIDEVLLNIQKLHNSLLLSGNTVCQDEILTEALKRFTDKNGDASEKLVEILNAAPTAPPLLAYIVLCDYEAGSKRNKPVKVPHLTNAKKVKMSMCLNALLTDTNQSLWDRVKRKGVFMIPNPQVTTALKGLLGRSLAPKPEGERIKGRYLVTMDMRPRMFRDFQRCKSKGDVVFTDDLMEALNIKVVNRNVCFWNNHTSPGNAAVLLALYMCSHVADVTIAVFVDGGIQCVSLEKPDKSLLSPSEALLKMKSVTLGAVSLSSPVEWAMAQDQNFDLFVNIVRTTAVTTRLPKEQREAGANPHATLCQYHEKINPHAGMVNISLGRLSNVRSDYNKKRILDIFGFDQHIPDLIHRFAGDARDKL